ncbi:MAG TPA: DUF924 family protein [Paracoccaceae bacterium]|nr:DUF924 family protein [Paracoccaceae bacterium]
MVTPDSVLKFWLDEKGPDAWYAGGEALDTEIRERFSDAWDELMQGGFGLWLTYPSGALAYIILADQFPRNMFRGEAKAFASDKIARAASKAAISRDWDLKIDEPVRQFFYLPLMHSENLSDQDRAVRLICTRMPETGQSNLVHARAHREVIRKHGRFPFRNEALGRKSTGPESTFLSQGGYMAIVNELRAASAA